MHAIDQIRDVVTGNLIPASVVKGIINRDETAVPGWTAVQRFARIRVVDWLRRPQHVMPSAPYGSTVAAWNANPYHISWDDTDLSPLVLDGTGNTIRSTKTAPQALDPVMTWDGSAKNTAGPMRTFEFSMLHPACSPLCPPGWDFPFNPFTQMLQVSAVLRCGPYTLEIPKGSYTFPWPSIQHKPELSIYSYKGMDLTAQLASTEFISTYVVPMNWPGGMLQALADMLHSPGRPISKGGKGITPVGNDDSGPDIPYSLMTWMAQQPDGSWKPTGADAFGNQPVNMDLPWDMGHSRADAAKQIADALTFYPVHMTDWTTFRTRMRPTYGTPDNPVYPPIDWDYSTVNGVSPIAADGFTMDFAFLGDGMKNVARFESDAAAATGTNGALITPLSSLQLNDNLQSAVSLPNLMSLSGGERALTAGKKLSGVTLQALMDAAAKLEVELGAAVSETIMVPVPVNPLVEEWDHLKFQVSTPSGRTLVASALPFVCTKWRLPLRVQGTNSASLNAGSFMTLTLSGTAAV